MDERVLGATGSGASVGRRRRLRAMLRGYRIPRRLGWTGLPLAVALWLTALSPALAESGSRYSAPLWTWIAAIAVAAGLSLAGLAIGYWFLRKRRQ